MTCDLCGGTETPFHEDARRRYLRCQCCRLVSVPSALWLSEEAERGEYDLHQNDSDDIRYRNFLSRLCEPLLALLAPRSRGLDFGCGPGPTLSVMLAEAGHSVALYDKFYQPHREVFAETYDFVTATEVIEHLHQPRQELESLWRVLRPGGVLALMTQRVIDLDAFRTWGYKEDLTHIRFFSEETFLWLAQRWQARCVIEERDVVFVFKPLE